MSRCAAICGVLLLSAACGSSPAPGPSPVTTPLPTSDPRFDLAFYRQLVGNAYEAPIVQPLQRLTASPSIYLQRTGLSDGFVAQLEQTAREIIPAFTGSAIQLAAWETGTEARTDRSGWITVSLRNDEAAACGQANVGTSSGHIWLNTAARCGRDGEPVTYASAFAHEIGHALGFYHVDVGLMNGVTSTRNLALTDRERYHGAVAYTQANGSRP